MVKRDALENPKIIKYVVQVIADPKLEKLWLKTDNLTLHLRSMIYFNLLIENNKFNSISLRFKVI